MSSRPLQYESLKAVIKHLDPNFRFKLCLWLPSYRSFDRVVPLKLQLLEFKPYEFIVNGTSYRLGNYRDYGEGEAPGMHRRLNEMGGASSDFDQYGFQIAPADEVRTPGDFLISSSTMPPFGPQTDEQAQRIEAQSRVLEYVIAKGRGEDVGPPPVHRNDLNYGLIAKYENRPAVLYHSLQQLVDQQRNNVLPFRYRRTGTFPPYRKFVRLNVRDLEKDYFLRDYHIEDQYNMEGIRFTHDFKEDRKIHELHKSLTYVYFGRRDPIDVEHLVVKSDNFVIRLPPGIKLIVQKLTTGANVLTVCNGLESIITATPLKVVRAIRCGNDFNHPILNTAEELVFSDDRSDEKWIQTFLTLRNVKISVAISRFTVEEYRMMVQDMLDSPRDVGACMRFGLKDSTLRTKIMGSIQRRFQGVRTGARIDFQKILHSPVIMISSRPLQYDSLKAVIQQMDANIRFKLLLKLPSIRKIDRVVPLKIQRLEFKPYEFIVNETSYRLGIYRDYGELDVPREHRRENEKGGIDCDLDQYGFQDEEAVEATTPGDILIRREDPEDLDVEELRDEDIDEYKLRVQVHAYVLASKRGEDVGAPPVDENHHLYQIILREELVGISSTLHTYDYQQNFIFPYVHRKAGRLPPYKKFVKLNVSGQWSLSYDFEENSKLFLVQKNFTGVLFGHRSCGVNVNHLLVNWNYKGYTIRLPPGMKIRIRKLSLDRNNFVVYKAIQSIIDPSSYPLEVATLDEYFEDPHVRSARRLEFHVLRDIDVLLRVNSREITSRFTYLTVQDYVRLVENLFDRPRESETCLSFGQIPFNTLETLANILRAMKTRFEKAKVEERRVTIPSEDSSQQIAVWYEYTRDPIYGIDWTLVVKVEDYRD